MFSHGCGNNNYAVTTEGGRAWKLLTMQDRLLLSFLPLHPLFCLHCITGLLSFCHFYIVSQNWPFLSAGVVSEATEDKKLKLLLEACQAWYCVIRLCALAVVPPVSLQMKFGTETIFYSYWSLLFFYGCLLRKCHWNRSAMAPDCFNSCSLFPISCIDFMSDIT